MGLLKEETKIIYGVKHTIISDKNGGFVAYYIISPKGNRILHREDGEPAFVSKSSVEYHINGSQSDQHTAQNIAELKKIEYLKVNVGNF
jgi:hypothetical protein